MRARIVQGLLCQRLVDLCQLRRYTLHLRHQTLHQSAFFFGERQAIKPPLPSLAEEMAFVRGDQVRVKNGLHPSFDADELG
ncbi:hypothetical protein ADT71_12890 [Novosphingobium sp. ST904]|nr:hypothetical protein ADT71_12890 [Novosphingobium sp. ST904]